MAAAEARSAATASRASGPTGPATESEQVKVIVGAGSTTVREVEAEHEPEQYPFFVWRPVRSISVVA
jgi:hypothetical protein